MAALLGPWRMLFALGALASSCATYGPELVDGALPQGGSAGEGGATAGATSGTGQQGGKAGDAPNGGTGAAAGSSGSSTGGSDGGAVEPYLRGDLDMQPSTIILSNQGTTDWVHWGLKGPADRNQKAGVTSQLLDFKPHGSAGPVAYASGPVAYSWNDGSPTAAATTHAGIAWDGAGQGFELSTPAVSEERIARVFVGVRAGTALLSAQLSEAGVPAFEEMVESDGDSWMLKMVTLQYGAVDTADATLTITFNVATATSASAAAHLGAISIGAD